MNSSLLEFAQGFDALQLPIGVYFVGEDGHFIACNQPVRQMLGLPLEGLVDANIKDFYADSEERPRLLQRANEAHVRGEALQRETVVFRARDQEVYLEMYCKPWHDTTTGEQVGYVGCLVDITRERENQRREAELRRKVEEFALDIGRVLHVTSATLLMTQHTLDSVLEALDQRPLTQVLAASMEDTDKRLLTQATQLAAAVERLSQAADPERRLKAFDENTWQMLNARAALLRQIEEVVPDREFRIGALREAARNILLACRDAPSGVLAREPLRDVTQNAAQLERLACVSDVVPTRTAIIQMDLSLRADRDFVTTDVRKHEPMERLPVTAFIEQAITQMTEFAKSVQVEIVWRDRKLEAIVEAQQRDLVRTLANLLHNAIKYTWQRDRTRAPWVTIRAHTHERQVCIEFENWGVPITREEIDDGLIFTLGYRGMWSRDRGRLGTGIGLTDAQRVAQAHGGELRVDSRPAAKSLYQHDDLNYYNQPFITTVTLCLPWAGMRVRD